MVQSTPGRTVTDMEREIEAQLRHRPPLHEPGPAPVAPPTISAPALGMPEYVEHREGATEIGKLSAEAIVKEYEATAKEIEAMGEFVKEMVQRCEQLTASSAAMLKDIKLTAMRYRKEGKRMFNEIESCSTTTDEVRKLCESFRDRVVTKASEGAT